MRQTAALVLLLHVMIHGLCTKYVLGNREIIYYTMWRVLLANNWKSSEMIHTAESSVYCDVQASLTLLIMVVRSPPLSSGFWASPTLDGSLRAFSLENVLHSEPTSITRSPGEKRFGTMS